MLRLFRTIYFKYSQSTDLFKKELDLYMTSLYPITTPDKKCRFLKDNNFISAIGDYIAEPVSIPDLLTLIDMSDVVLYNEDRLYSGRVKTVVVNLGGGGSWLRLNASKIDDGSIRSILQQFDCK